MYQLNRMDNLFKQLSAFKSTSQNKADDSSQTNCQIEFASILQGEIVNSQTSQYQTTVNSELISIPFDDRLVSNLQPVFLKNEVDMHHDIGVFVEVTMSQASIMESAGTESEGQKTENEERKIDFHLPAADGQLQQQLCQTDSHSLAILYLKPKETGDLMLNSQFKAPKLDESTDVSTVLKPENVTAYRAENHRMWNTSPAPTLETSLDGTKMERQFDVRWLRLPAFRRSETPTPFIPTKSGDSRGTESSETPHLYTSYFVLTEASDTNEVLEKFKQQAEHIVPQLKESTEKITPTEEIASAGIEVPDYKSPETKIEYNRSRNNDMKLEPDSEPKGSDGVTDMYRYNRGYLDEAGVGFQRLTGLIQPAEQNPSLNYTSAPSSVLELNVINQIGHEIHSMRLKELKVQLKPEHLGYVTLKASMVEGVLAVDISAENAAVKSIIESHSHHLRQLLSQQGIEVGQFNVSAESNMSSFGSQQGMFSSYPGNSSRNVTRKQSDETLEQEHRFARQTAIDIWI